MNILVIGCGKVGSRLANSLSDDGHDVSVVDRLESSLEALSDDFDGMTTLGVPIDKDVLKKAGIENCDALAAVSRDDNVNIMVSELAREIFKVPNVLARIYDPNREDVFSHFGLHTVCPTNMTVAAIRSALLEQGTVRSVLLGSHTVTFHTVAVPKEYWNHPCSDVRLNHGEQIFAVLHPDLAMELASEMKQKLSSMDQLIIAKLVD